MADQQMTDRSPAEERLRNAATSLVVRKPDMEWLDTPREKVRKTLGQSMFVGAKPESIDMVMDYCEAAGLNPFLKPVHIVPMNVKVPGTRDKYEWRDVVMPGITHYRTQASRTGTYLGKSEPKFGRMVERSWDAFTMMVPEWCEVTVKRLVAGHVAEFTALEFWDENYATKGRDTKVPNAMWQRRPHGQLHKCAEAQALRMAFPELVGDYTAEEMEGKTIDLTAEEVERKPAAVRSLDAFAGGKEAEDAEVEDVSAEDEGTGGKVVASDEMPRMPDEYLLAFEEKKDWLPGWKWLNETLERQPYTQGVYTALGVEYADILWAAYDRGGPQKKAVVAFTEKYGIIVPPKKEGGAAAK